MRYSKMIKKLVVSTILGLAFSAAAQADAFVFGSSNFNARNVLTIVTDNGTYALNNLDSGWWNQSMEHNASNKNYIVGECCGHGNYNDYFTFNLSDVTGNIRSASLTLYSFQVTTNATFSLMDVSTPISALTATGTNTAIYTDLMSGVSYGNRSYSSLDSNTFQTISFNNAGIAALTAARGGDFAVGGTIAAVPEPETYAMLLAGLGLMGGLARRRKQ